VTTLVAVLALLVVWNDLKELVITDVLDSDSGTLINTLVRSLTIEVFAVPYISAEATESPGPVGVRSPLPLKSVNESEEKQTSHPVSDPPVCSVNAGVVALVPVPELVPPLKLESLCPPSSSSSSRRCAGAFSSTDPVSLEFDVSELLSLLPLLPPRLPLELEEFPILAVFFLFCSNEQAPRYQKVKRRKAIRKYPEDP